MANFFTAVSAIVAKEATPEAKDTIKEYFPAAVEQSSYIANVAEKLAELGIKKGNSIALVSTCRDEASRILDAIIAEHYGLIFNLNGLAGVPPGGTLAITAGTHHSPVDADGKERYVFFGVTHIGVDESGQVGKIKRLGRPGISGACGALLHLSDEFAKKVEGPTAPSEDAFELFYLRKKLEAKNPEPNVVDVTKATADIINDTLEDHISKVVNKTKADYAVITGIQIHSGVNVSDPFEYSKVAEYFVPSLAYAVINGEKKELAL